MTESSNKMTCGVIMLSGGIGSRLGELTKSKQKCALDIHGQPFIKLMIQSFYKIGVKEIVLLSGYRSKDIYKIQKQIRTENPKHNLTVIEETMPLGTGGALYNVPSIPDVRNWVVTNGDTYFDNLNVIKRLIDSTERRPKDIVLVNGFPAFREGTAGTVALKKKDLKWSEVLLREDEKPIVFSGISILPSEALTHTKNTNESFSELIKRLHIKKYPIVIKDTPILFYDIGTVQRLQKFREIKKGQNK